jgi:hypothetical protein
MTIGRLAGAALSIASLAYVYGHADPRDAQVAKC